MVICRDFNQSTVLVLPLFDLDSYFVVCHSPFLVRATAYSPGAPATSLGMALWPRGMGAPEQN